MPEAVSRETRDMANELIEALGSDTAYSKLLESLKDYSCSDKIRWNSTEGFKGRALTDRYLLQRRVLQCLIVNDIAPRKVLH